MNDETEQQPQSFTKEDLEKAFHAGTFYGNQHLEDTFAELDPYNPTKVSFEKWMGQNIS